MNNLIFSFAMVLATIFSILALSQQVYAGDTTVASEQLFLQIRQHQVVKGHFEQLRTLTGIPRPIHSSGRFIYWRDHGLYWETREPIAQASTFTPTAIIYWQTTTTSQQPDRNSSPIQRQVSRILLAVFGGDIQSLEKLFDSHWSFGSESGTKQWTVDLTPTMAAVKQVVEKITLRGGKYVKKLSLDASNGDTTQIQFTNISTFAYPAVDDCPYFDLDSSSCPGDETATLPANQRKP